MVAVRRVPVSSRATKPRRTPAAGVRTALGELNRQGKKSVRDGMARYAISAPKVFGVPVGTIRQLGTPGPAVRHPRAVGARVD